MEAAQQVVLQAVTVLQSPSAGLAERAQANQFLEQFKKGDAHILAAVAGGMTNATLPIEVQVVGYSLLTDLVNVRWGQLTEMEHTQLSQLAYQNMGIVCAGGKAAWPLKTKAAVLLAAVVRQQGPPVYAQLVPQLIQQASEGPAQAELACMVLHFLCEDLNQFDALQGDAKRLLLQALTSSAPTVFPFLCEMLQQHFMAAMQSQQAGAADKLAAHSAVISASLGALTTWVEWTPMARVAASNVVDACAFFLTAPEFALQGLDVLKHIVSRKRSTESWEEYSGLIDKVARLLLAKVAEIGLLVPPQSLPQALSDQLGWEGSLEEFGKRLCNVAVTLCELHWRALEQEQRRLQLLQLLLVFTGHPYLHLPAITLPLWGQLLRETVPSVAAAAGAKLPDSQEGGSATQKGGGPPPAPIPTECLQVLMSILANIMRSVIIVNTDVAAEGSSNGGTADGQQGRPSTPGRTSSSGAALAPPGVTFPEYFDTYQEWREFSFSMRGQAKNVLKAAALAAPEPALALMGQYIQAAVTVASGPDSGTTVTQAALQNKALTLTVTSHIIEAVIPALLDVTSTSPQGSSSILDGLAAMLQAVLGLRFTQPYLVTTHAHCIEAFGRLLGARPELAAPTVGSVFSAMASLPLEGSGQLPPPPRMTKEWRYGFEARLALANAIVNLIKVAPFAFAPHLKPLADQIAVMWDAGQLREGERVMLWEGLLTAAAAAPTPGLLGQMVSWVLAPLASQWNTPEWQARISSEQAFVQAYMPVQSAPNPPGPGSSQQQQQPSSQQQQSVTIGSRSERWALYHQLTLVERAFRRVAPLTSIPGQSFGQGSGAGQIGRVTDSGAPQGPSTPVKQAGTANGAHSAADATAASPGGLAAAIAAGAAAAADTYDYAMNAHLTWILPPVANLLGIVHGLGAADAAGLLGPLTGLTGMDEVEKAVRMGADAESMVARELKEPRCVAGTGVADARYFLRGIREVVSMVISLAATHCSSAAFWSSAPLAAALVPRVTSHLDALDANHVRLLLRHCVTPLVTRCPPAYASLWSLPLCAACVPHCASRLSRGWSQSAVLAVDPIASAAAAGAGAGVDPHADKENRKSAEVTEVVADNLLREFTREAMAFLLALTNPPVVPGARQPPGSTTGPLGVGGTSGTSGAGAAGTPGGGGGKGRRQTQSQSGTGEDQEANGAAGGGAQQQQQQGPSIGPIFEMLLTSEPNVAQAVVSTAVAGMCWPDAESISKAVSVCKYLVTLGTTLAPLEQYVVRDLLRSAIMSLVQGASATMQSDLLALLRLLFNTYLARPSSAQAVRDTLSSLLQLSPQAVADFERALMATHVEKDQRALIKQLVVQAGGEEVRKLLAAPTTLIKLAGSGPQLGAGGAKGAGGNGQPKSGVKAQPGSGHDPDASLQGAIYNAIFDQ